MFNKKMILFVKNGKSVEMSNIGVVKYKHVGCIDLKNLKKIDIKDIVDVGSRVQVYPQEDRTYSLFFVVLGSVLTRVIMDCDKKIISPSKTVTSISYPIYQYKKQKNNIFVNCIYFGNFCIVKLNLDLSVAKYVNIDYNLPFLSANDTHVYAYLNNQLFIFNNELVFVKQVGQSNNPTAAFYLPTGIKQFESHKGMY